MKFKRLEVYEQVMFDEKHLISDAYTKVLDEDGDFLVLLGVFQDVEIISIVDKGAVAKCAGAKVAKLEGDGILSVDVLGDYVKIAGRPLLPLPEILDVEYPYAIWRAYF